MKVNDRGTMKWTSIMLPEHIEALNQMWTEQEKVEKPILDQQQIEENSFKLEGSMRHKLEVKITYFLDHDFKNIEGLIKTIKNKTVFINDSEINFDDILEVEFVNSIFDPY